MLWNRVQLSLISDKPFTAPTVVDSDGKQTYEWTVGFNECDVIQPTNSAGTKYQYELFFNSNRWVLILFRFQSINAPILMVAVIFFLQFSF